MPDVLYPLSRRLLDLETAARPLRLATVPPVISLSRFKDDPVGEFDTYCNDLEQAFDANRVDAIIVIVDSLSARPPGLKPPWVSPKMWLEWTPDALELRDARPDLRSPPAPRPDWEGPLVSPLAYAPPEPFQAPVERSPVGIGDSEHIAVLRRSLERWQRAGGALADLDLPRSSYDQVDAAPASAPAMTDVTPPLPEAPAPTLRIGGSRRAPAPELLDAGASGPFGGTP
jgi:hypothetical protein